MIFFKDDDRHDYFTKHPWLKDNFEAIENSQWLNSFIKTVADNNPNLKAFKGSDLYTEANKDLSFFKNLHHEESSYVYQSDSGSLEYLPRALYNANTLDFMAQYIDPITGNATDRWHEIFDSNRKFVVNEVAFGLCEDLPLYDKDDPIKQALVENGEFKPIDYHISEAVNDYLNISKDLVNSALEKTFKDRYYDVYEALSKEADLKLPSELTNNTDDSGHTTYYRDRLAENLKNGFDTDKALDALHLGRADYVEVVDAIGRAHYNAQSDLTDSGYKAHLIKMPDFENVTCDEKQERHFFKFLAKSLDKSNVPPMFMENYVSNFSKLNNLTTENLLYDFAKSFIKTELLSKENTISHPIKKDDVLNEIFETTSQKINEVAQSKEPIKAALSQEQPINQVLMTKSISVPAEKSKEPQTKGAER